MILGTVLLYALSIGPMARIDKGRDDRWIPSLWFFGFYSPLIGASKVVPFAEDLLDEYVKLWVHGEQSK
jgi:hypothetical protein